MGNCVAGAAVDLDNEKKSETKDPPLHQHIYKITSKPLIRVISSLRPVDVGPTSNSLTKVLPILDEVKVIENSSREYSAETDLLQGAIIANQLLLYEPLMMFRSPKTNTLKTQITILRP